MTTAMTDATAEAVATNCRSDEVSPIVGDHVYRGRRFLNEQENDAVVQKQGGRPERPLYLRNIRIPWEWLGLPELLLPLAAVATGYDAAKLIDNTWTMLEWRLPEVPDDVEAIVAAAVEKLAPQGTGWSADPLFEAFELALAACGREHQGGHKDVTYRLIMTLDWRVEQARHAPSLDGDFSRFERDGGYWVHPDKMSAMVTLPGEDKPVPWIPERDYR